jgi:hypothetical protein
MADGPASGTVARGVSRPAPVHRLAWTAFVLASVALVLAWYGSLHAEKHLAGSPLRAARGPANVIGEPGPWYERVVDRTEASIFGERFDQAVLAATERSRSARVAVHAVAFVLPFVLGLAAAWMGGNAMTAIERAGGTRSGNFQAVFAVMIGGFAAVIAGCMLFSVHVWPVVPAAYTS